MIGTLMSLLTSGVGGYIAAAVAPIVVAGGIWAGVAWHDSTVRDALLVRQRAEAAAATIQRQQAAMSALSGLIAQRDRAAAAQSKLIQEITNAPPTTGCADRPAIADALRGLRDGGASPQPAEGAGGAADTGTGANPADAGRD